MRKNQIQVEFDPAGYYWVENGKVVRLDTMATENLRRALCQSIDTLTALQKQGLQFEAPFEAWKDNSGQYVWMQGGAMRDVADLSRSGLLQAHYSVMDVIEDADESIATLARTLEAWRKGEFAPAAEALTA